MLYPAELRGRIFLLAFLTPDIANRQHRNAALARRKPAFAQGGGETVWSAERGPARRAKACAVGGGCRPNDVSGTTSMHGSLDKAQF